MRHFIALVLIVILSACGPPEQGAPIDLAAPPAGKAQIYLIRPSTIVGAGNLQLTAFNGTPVAKLQVGQYTRVPVDPGLVVVTFRERVQGPLPLLDIRILQEIGGFYEVGRTQIGTGASAFMQFPELEWIDADKAVRLMGVMTEVEPVKGK